MGATSAEEAAEEGQEELRSMLEAWQSMLDHIASPHQDISAAPGELASLHAAAKRHMDALSEHATTIDSAASSKVSTSHPFLWRNPLEMPMISFASTAAWPLFHVSAAPPRPTAFTSASPHALTPSRPPSCLSP
jgi:hypothetical protein